MEINFVVGKNGGHRPSSLGGRSIVVVSEWVSEWMSEWDEMLAAFTFDSKAHLSCLNGFMVLMALYE